MKIQTVDQLLASLKSSSDSVVQAMRESPSRVSEHYKCLVEESARLVQAIAVIQQEIAISESVI